MGSSNRDTYFSSHRSAIPFGKFESGSEDIFPCNESMIGREGARAKLIDFLTNGGTRRAILVTGRRGMGKTSFVNYCLKEYEEARVERYWRSDIGRTLTSWLWLTIITLICAGIFMIGGWLLKILLDNAIYQGNYILWFPIAVLVFYLAYPLKHATKMVSVLFDIKPTLFMLPQVYGILTVTSLIALIAITIPDGGSPVLVLSRLIVAIAAIYFVGELADIRLLSLYGQRLGGRIQPMFGAFVVLLTYFFDPIICFRNDCGNEGTVFFSNFLITSIFLGLAAINRWVSLCNKPKHIGTLQISTAINRSKNIYLYLGVCLVVLPFLITFFSSSLSKLILNSKFDLKFNLSFGWFSFLVLGIFITAIVAIDYRKKEEKKPETDYRKRYLYSTAILFPKAIFFILLSLYALHPLLTLTNLPSQNLCNWQASSNDYMRPYCNVNNEADIFENDKNNQYFSPLIKSYLPQLLDQKHEIAYICLITLITSMIFWIEYEWVIRPGQIRRRDKSLSVSKRPNYYEDFDQKEYEFTKITETGYEGRQNIRNELQKFLQHQANIRERHRALESLTFLGYFKNIHLTTLVSTINLGFEELDHRSVIHAMLLDIREQYFEKFVSLRSPRAFIRTAFGLLLAMLLVTYLSATFFQKESVEALKRPLVGTLPEPEKGIGSIPSKMALIRLLNVHLSAGFNSISENDTSNHKGDITIDANSLRQSKKFEGIPKYSVTIPASDFNGKNQQEIVIAERKNLILQNKYCQRKETSKYLNAASQHEISGPFDHLPKIPRLLCELGGMYAENFLPFIYFELVSISTNDAAVLKTAVLNWPFDTHTPYFICNFADINQCQETYKMSFYIYDLLLFLSIFYLFRRFNRTFEFTPFSANLEKIDALLNAMTSTTRTKSSRDFPRLIRLTSGFMENEKSLEREKLDPRLVELQFMSILETICHSRSIYFKPLQSVSRSPTIEITFVFDELDKLATDIKSQQNKGDIDNNDSELHRLNLMKGLLSNMKRIITSSEARYIFLGGRLLHDDWLADGARRQPLLTSIFSDEIYLSSLLTDANIDWYKPESDKEYSPGSHFLNTRIEEYLIWQYYLAWIRFEQWVTRVWEPIVGLPKWDVRRRGFIQLSYKDLKKKIFQAVEEKTFPAYIKTPLETLTVRDTHTGIHLNEGNFSSTFEHNRLESFIQFLAYRSAGNPKYLNELLASFVISANRAIDNTNAIDEGFNCQDVIYLPDHKVMRIQLVARIYRHLKKGFEEKIRGRDDKTISSLIYLSDFIMKFHSRAFSWESLELIDELVHMHRGHDLRTLLHELVAHYTDRFLHRIINGMYTYRFRSYFSNEIKYLSSHSEEEMAAFNFTLDEAQTLRSHLESQLDSNSSRNKSDIAGERENRNKTDILSMLGELHEFYQEYEMARQYYRRCINARLPMIKEHIGDRIGKGDDEMSVIQAIYTDKPASRDALLALQQWGPITLRWFLLIVMTYEKEHNYTDALIRYERYITFAEAMIKAFATEEPVAFDPAMYKDSANNKLLSDHAFVLEYLGLLCEPLFAYAWILEKNSYTSGNSHFVLSEGIRRLNKILTNVKPEYLGFIQAQWYKKAGALCFYKGLAASMEEMNKKGQKKFKAKPYIEHAREYYVLSARKLSIYFRKGVKTKYNNKYVKSSERAIRVNHYSTDHNFCVAECLGDLSESILAEVNPIELFELDIQNYSINRHSFDKTVVWVLRQLDDYFFNSERQEGEEHILNLFSNNYCKNDYELLNNLQKIDLALNLSFSSTLYLVRAGYLESAAREAMHIAEIIAQYFNWFWFRNVTKDGQSSSQSDSQYSVVEPIMEKIIWYTKYIYQLFGSLRSGFDTNTKANNDKKYLMGDSIPSSALTSLCSIGMALSFFLLKGYSPKTSNLVDNLKNLCSIIQKWTGEEQPIYDTRQDPSKYPHYFYDFFEKKLIYSLQRHRYSVLNQLNGLKTLVDASLIRGYMTNDITAVINTKAWLQELFHINEKYNHPMHFTPTQFGLSLYLYFFVKSKNVNEFVQLDEIKDFNLLSECKRFLRQSLDMSHMGRGYYEAIDNMYYLYDDFNDNQIHRNHALQMAGSELVKEALINPFIH